MKRIVVFDLDETIIDSAHRTPNREDGTLDLGKYLELKNRKSIMQDSLLPLADVFKSLDRKDNYIVICTARPMDQDDFDFLYLHGLTAHNVMCRPMDGSENSIADADLKARKISRLRNLRQFRGLPVLMFDDAKPVIAKMRSIGVACLNAIAVNRKLVEV